MHRGILGPATRVDKGGTPSQNPRPMRVTVRLFAGLAERHGTRELQRDVPDGTTADALFRELFPGGADAGWRQALLVAVNRTYVARQQVLHEGDEVAFLPPLGGGSGAADPRVALLDQPLSVDGALATVTSTGRGGIVTFEGRVRDTFEGKGVVRLEYEAWPDMALPMMSALCDDIATRWPGASAAIHHRVGTLLPGDCAVIIAVAAPHRGAAFEACRHGIDTLKATIPIWKKEIYTDGSSWKEQGGG